MASIATHNHKSRPSPNVIQRSTSLTPSTTHRSKRPNQHHSQYPNCIPNRNPNPKRQTHPTSSQTSHSSSPLRRPYSHQHLRDPNYQLVFSPPLSSVSPPVTPYSSNHQSASSSSYSSLPPSQRRLESYTIDSVAVVFGVIA